MPPPRSQVSLGPVDSTGDGLREAIEALPPSLASLTLSPGFSATREGSGDGWCLHLEGGPRSVPAAQQLCAAFDRPGLRCSLEGQVALSIEPPAEGTPQASDTYLGRCTEVAGRLRSGPRNVELTLDVAGAAGGDGGADGGAAEGGGGFLGRVLGAVLPAAAPCLWSLQLQLASSAYPPGWSRHFTVPGLAFPVLKALVLNSSADFRCMAAADVAALARVTAPRLRHVQLLLWGPLQRGAGRLCARHGPAGAGELQWAARPPDHLCRVPALGRCGVAQPRGHAVGGGTGLGACRLATHRGRQRERRRGGER
jgi:hypothetical protein